MSVKVFPPSLARVLMLNLTLTSPFHDIKGGKKAGGREGGRGHFVSDPLPASALRSVLLRCARFPFNSRSSGSFKGDFQRLSCQGNKRVTLL